MRVLFGAVARLHSAGVVHNDLHVGNVLLQQVLSVSLHCGYRVLRFFGFAV